MKTYFDHEKLDAYQEAIAFCDWVGDFLGAISAKNQLARIVQMLIGLLRKFSERADVLREEAPAYSIEHDYEHEQENELE